MFVRGGLVTKLVMAVTLIKVDVLQTLHKHILHIVSQTLCNKKKYTVLNLEYMQTKEHGLVITRYNVVQNEDKSRTFWDRFTELEVKHFQV